SWEQLFEGSARRQFEDFLRHYIAGRRWFVHKARTVTSAQILDMVEVRSEVGRGAPPLAAFLIVRLELDFGESEHYVMPVAWAPGEEADELCRWRPDSVLAELSAGGARGVLHDALWSPDFVRTMVESLSSRRSFAGSGRLSGVPTPFRRLVGSVADVAATPLSAEQSNTSVAIADRALFKLIRRFEPGINPSVELGRYLGERARFPGSPKMLGHVEYQSRRPGTPSATIAVLEELIPNEGDGWGYVVDALDHVLEDFLATSHGDALAAEAPPRLLEVQDRHIEPGHPLIGPHLEWASLLGRHTAELHHALGSDHSDAALAPEPLSLMDRQAMFHGARILARRAFRQA
ncbi:MAG: maltokinase N-terminal cap-like domain-containing protein, partial [Acidimicrobiales bacterium]